MAREHHDGEVTGPPGQQRQQPVQRAFFARARALHGVKRAQRRAAQRGEVQRAKEQRLRERAARIERRARQEERRAERKERRKAQHSAQLRPHGMARYQTILLHSSGATLSRRRESAGRWQVGTAGNR